jgi:hypothetical protein
MGHAAVDLLVRKMDASAGLQAETAAELDALVLFILDCAFNAKL